MMHAAEVQGLQPAANDCLFQFHRVSQRPNRFNLLFEKSIETFLQSCGETQDEATPAIPGPTAPRFGGLPASCRIGHGTVGEMADEAAETIKLLSKRAQALHPRFVCLTWIPGLTESPEITFRRKKL